MSIDSTQLLPNELLGDCIGRTDITTVLCASRVCARWRTIAHDSPIFWRSIKLSAASNSALSLFHARITYTDCPGIAVQISLPFQPKNLYQATHERAVTAAAMIQSELENNLGRIASLLISAPQLDMRIIAPALAIRVDILERLVLRIPPIPGGAGDTALVWDARWVHTCAPRLRFLVLENIGLPLKPPGRWFTAATTVKIFYTKHCIATIPVDVFDRFPSCQDIEIDARPLARLRLGHPSRTAPPRAQPYSSVALSAVTASLLPLIPHASSTPTIDVLFTGGFDMNTLIGQLSDPLECSLHYDRSASGVSVAFTEKAFSSTTRRVRTARLPGKAVVDPNSTLLLALTESAMPRVVKLKINLVDLEILRRTGSISNVKMLAIYVAPAASPSDWAVKGLVAGWARGALPLLERIMLRSTPPGLALPEPELVRTLLNRLKCNPSRFAGSEWGPRIVLFGFAPPPSAL